MLKKTIDYFDQRNGGKPPRGYGMAYQPYNALTTVYYPVPLNWIVWAARRLYIRLRHAPIDKQMADLLYKVKEEAEADQYGRGFKDGFNVGQDQLKAEIMAEIRAIRNDMNLEGKNNAKENDQCKSKDAS